MQYNVNIKIAGDAFYRLDDDGHGEPGAVSAEVARILRGIASKVEENGYLSEHVLFDHNGNRVGLAAQIHD